MSNNPIIYSSLNIDDENQLNDLEVMREHLKRELAKVEEDISLKAKNMYEEFIHNKQSFENKYVVITCFEKDVNTNTTYMYIDSNNHQSDFLSRDLIGLMICNYGIIPNSRYSCCCGRTYYIREISRETFMSHAKLQLEEMTNDL